MFSNARRVLSQCNTRLRLLYLLTMTASFKNLEMCSEIENIIFASKRWTITLYNCATELQQSETLEVELQQSVLRSRTIYWASLNV